MKNLFIAILFLGAGVARASQYDCKLSDGSVNNPKAIIFSFDTVKEQNKTVNMGEGTAVGCAVVRTGPPILSCGLYNEKFSISAIAEDGSSVIGFNTNSGGYKSQLICVKKP
jgi:hypothetical protein